MFLDVSAVSCENRDYMKQSTASVETICVRCGRGFAPTSPRGQPGAKKKFPLTHNLLDTMDGLGMVKADGFVNFVDNVRTASAM